MSDQVDSDLLDAFAFDQDDEWLERARLAATRGSLGALGPYELLEEVGRGGQGVVYRARTDDGSLVAVKRLVGTDLVARRRLARELRLARQLDHPCIVRVHELLEIDGRALLVMEWIEGESVTSWSAGPGPRRSIQRALEVFEQVVDAIAHAHGRGVLHRDVKPSNVRVGADDRPHVLDLGLAKHMGEATDASLTQTSGFLGTPTYAAPEQLRGDASAVDERTDVYGLGVLLCAMLTGDTPYPASSSPRVALDQFERGSPRRPSALDPRVGRDLETIILKAAHPDMGQRYASAAELRDDVRRARSGMPVRARLPGRWYELRKLARQHVLGLAVVSVALLSTVAWGTHAAVQARSLARERDRAESAYRFAARYAATRDEVLGFFLRDLLMSAGSHAGGPLLTVPEILAAAEGHSMDRFQGRPAIEAAVLEAVGGAYLAVGDALSAERQLARAVLLAIESGCVPPDELARMHRLHGDALLALGRVDLVREAIVAAELAQRFDHTPEGLEPGALALLQARLAVWEGRPRDAIGCVDEGLKALANGASSSPDADRLEAGLLGERARSRLALGDLAGALEDLEGASHAKLAYLPVEHVEHAVELQLRGEVRLKQGLIEDASAAFREVDHARVLAWGEDDPRRDEVQEALARASLLRGEVGAALDLTGALLDRLARRGGSGGRLSGQTLRTRADALAADGSVEAARELRETAVERDASFLGEAHPEVVVQRALLAGEPVPGEAGAASGFGVQTRPRSQ